MMTKGRKEMVEKLLSLLKNKVFLYLTSRYIVYFLQFVVFLMIAEKMGPYNYGVWGFCMMLLNYMCFINLGIANSTNVLLVQHKSETKNSKDFVSSSIASIGFLIVMILVIALVYSQLSLPIFEKYPIGNLFYVICIIAILYHLNNLFCNIYRVYNRLLELSLYQSVVPIGLLIIVLVFKGSDILVYLLGAYFIAYLVALLIFLFRGGIPWGGSVSKDKIHEILKKGFFLFIYNASFYLILTTTSNVISYYYTVEEYGYYNFSYCLGHSVLLFLEAFTFVVYPKVLDKLYSSDIKTIKSVLDSIRTNYVSLSHGMMYFAFALFPLFIMFFPKYHDGLSALYFTALAVLLSTNSFGYNTLLIAQNHEKTSACIALLSLLANVLVGIIFSVIGLPFYLVVVCVMISYLFFAYLCGLCARKLIGQRTTIINVLTSIFPISLLVPFVIGFLVALFNLDYLSWLPFVCFVVLNLNTVKTIYITVLNVCVNPRFVDIKR